LIAKWLKRKDDRRWQATWRVRSVAGASEVVPLRRGRREWVISADLSAWLATRRFGDFIVAAADELK
jgi:hypothetical protein